MGKTEHGKKNAYLPPIYSGDQDDEIGKSPVPPMTTGTPDNRGKLPSAGSGVVEGSGSSAGGGGNVEDYDDDAAGGGGRYGSSDS